MRITERFFFSSLLFSQFPFLPIGQSLFWNLPVVSGQESSGEVYLIKDRSLSPNEKRTFQFRWKTTMVHGEDKTSPQAIPFVSRSPWHVSVLVLICLVARPSEGGEIKPAHFAPLQTVKLVASGIHLCDESRPNANPVKRITCQLLFACQPVFYHHGHGGPGQGEALSQVEIRDPLIRGSARTEAMPRSTRLTENQLPHGIIVRGPPWWKGERWSLLTEDVPSSGCFS